MNVGYDTLYIQLEFLFIDTSIFHFFIKISKERNHSGSDSTLLAP